MVISPLRKNELVRSAAITPIYLATRPMLKGEKQLASWYTCSYLRKEHIVQWN